MCRSARSSAAVSIPALIAALMTDVRGAPIDTFNIGFEGEVVSEHREAAAVARHIGSRHHAVMLATDDVLDAFDRLDRHFRRTVRGPGGAADDAARRLCAPARDGGADRRRRRRSVRRLRELSQARARGALRALARAPASPLPALVRLLPKRARKDRLLRAIAEPLQRRYRTVPNVFDALDPAFAADTFAAGRDSGGARTSAHSRRRPTPSAIRINTSIGCSTSTRGYGFPTTC